MPNTNPPSPKTVAAPPARLALANGTVFTGSAFGAIGKGIVSVAEVVFTTAMCGYQEALTDPSYTGQILVQTFPMIGNYGVNPDDTESTRVQVAGFVVRELARRHSNFRATTSLSDYLAREGVLGISGIDTRALTRILRTSGAMPGALTDRTDLSDADLVARAKSAPSMAGQNLVPRVGCNAGHSWEATLGDWALLNQPKPTRTYRVLALDCGAKANILRNLAQRGCELVVIPHNTPASEILRRFNAGEADGLFVSNGPGDPAAVDATIATLRTILNQPAAETIPTFGICLGHQLLALALGAKTYKLKFGHRGANQPILNTESGRVEITSQNHGFAVEADSLRAVGGVPTHTHLNDGTLAGFRHATKPVFSVQYHPEASPGPHDASYLFDQFVEAMSRRAPASR
ncbi:MAG: glutamine-hydrolyzing carbamoyl-phosphate synthase small subunit [Phycisphaerales bacterium]|nr:glutamine-hydrolyzing carbamoyl-phosphate synthase small subunit [Phycisphaerales bacterium]